MRAILSAGLISALIGLSGHADAAPTYTCAGKRATIVGTDRRDEIRGTSGPDVIHGRGGFDKIFGLGGDDIICGGQGRSVIKGGRGNDRIIGGDHQDVIKGGQGRDVIRGKRGDDLLIGNKGADVLRGGRGADVLVGGRGSDRLTGGRGPDVLDGGAHSDLVDGGRGADTASFETSDARVQVDLRRGVASGHGRDTLRRIRHATGSRFGDVLKGDTRANVLMGGRGSDLIKARGGRDYVHGGPGNDDLRGGWGRDTVAFVGGGGVEVDLAKGAATGQGKDRLRGFKDIEGSADSDRLLGDERENRFIPLRGADFLDGRGARDLASYATQTGYVDFEVDLQAGTISSELGTDRVVRIEDVEGGDGDDTFLGDEQDNVFIAGSGFNTFFDSPGNDEFRGGPWNVDLLDLSESPVPTHVDLAAGTATARGTHRLSGIERITGSDLDDVLLGNEKGNWIVGRGGSDVIDGRGENDSLWGEDGDDYLTGGDGDDRLEGAAGADELRGGPGIDLVSDGEGDDLVEAGDGDDFLVLGSGDDRIDGGVGTDVVRSGVDPGEPFVVDLIAGTASGPGFDVLSSIEGATGAGGSDRFSGDGGDNLFFGGWGDDVISGGPGDDLIATARGEDEVFGDRGDDYLVTGADHDRADGGPGVDECWKAEVEIDCEGGEDSHTPQFDEPYSDYRTTGMRHPRSVSLYFDEEGHPYGTVANLFWVRSCTNTVTLYIERLEDGRWETVLTPYARNLSSVPLGRYRSSKPVRPGTYRARLPSSPLLFSLGSSANCMGAVSEPVEVG